MSYIWEKYSEDAKYHISGDVCPYIEVFDSDGLRIGVNPLIRFSQIFNSTFESDEGSFVFDTLLELLGGECVEKIVDVIFHYLAQLDKTKGLDLNQRMIEKISEEIDKGLWGEKAKDLVGKMTTDDKEKILHVLCYRVQNDNQSYFMEAIGRAFSVSSLCFDKKTNKNYLFIGMEESDYNVNKLELIKLFFWSINRDLTVIWKYHYGIIGCDDTMHINEIQIV